jgi:small subunit ribosomal protein S16
MPVRIRLSRFGTKKRPFYRIVVADSRRARDGKFIERIGTYNPMLPKDHPERIKIDADKAKEWIQKGAQPSDRIHLFLSKIGVLDKPIITQKTKKHLPRKKEQEKQVKEKEEQKTAAEGEVKDASSTKEEEQKTAAEDEVKDASSTKEEEQKTNENKSDTKQSENSKSNTTKATEKKEKFS